MDTWRRGFLKLLPLGVGALLLAPFGRLWAASKVALPLSKAPKLQTVGGWAVLKVKGQDLLFVRDSDKTVKVLSAVCTHEKCTVKYDPAKSNVVCGCHGSSFSLAGAVLSKPATKNLPTYNATLADDKIIVELE